MRVERLICRFLLPGQYTVAEPNMAVTLRPEHGETVLAFRPVDNDPELCGPAGGRPVADALFMWKADRPGEPYHDRPTWIAVECKTSLAEPHAFEQVATLLGLVLGSMDRTAIGRVGGVVLTNHPPPVAEQQRWKKALRDATGLVVDVVAVPRGSTYDVRREVLRARGCRVDAVVKLAEREKTGLRGSAGAM